VNNPNTPTEAFRLGIDPKDIYIESQGWEGYLKDQLTALG
jgi:hypothetical protein